METTTSSGETVYLDTYNVVLSGFLFFNSDADYVGEKFGLKFEAGWMREVRRFRPVVVIL